MEFCQSSADEMHLLNALEQVDSARLSSLIVGCESNRFDVIGCQLATELSFAARERDMGPYGGVHTPELSDKSEIYVWICLFDDVPKGLELASYRIDPVSTGRV